MPVCYLALGGNTGDVAATISNALKTLHARGVDVLSHSRLYRTAPIGENAGDPFLNAAAEVTTTLAPHDLLDVLQQVEKEFGRERSIHWGPRTLDIDLILYGYEVIHTDRLTVPHPAAWYRRFVIDPLFEIAPQAFHPTQRARIETIRQRLLTRPLPVAVVSPNPRTGEELRERLSLAYPDQLAFVSEDRAAIIVMLDHSENSGNDPRIAPCVGQQDAINLVRAALDDPQPVEPQ